MQDARTSELVNPVAALVAELSACSRWHLVT